MEQESNNKKAFPVTVLFPNMITLVGLCLGLSSIRYAMSGRFELAVALLIFAAIIDGLDGRIARLLNSTSTFGAMLDSLSDFACFGVAPAMVMYFWVLHEVRGLGWAVVLFFAICCALRLARFNTSLFNAHTESWKKNFFTGVPAPAGAMLGILPLVLYFQWGDMLYIPAGAVIVYDALIAILMVSRIPTFAAKQLKIRQEMVLFVMMGAGFLIALFIIEPWLTFSTLGVIYLLVIPFSIRSWYKLSRSVTVE